MASIYHAVMRGGEVQAAGRMGVDELGQALKAFPDSLQAHAEPGGMFEPLYHDIERAREQHATPSPLPSPSDIAKGRNFTPQEMQAGNVHGKGNAQLAQVEVFMSEEVPIPGRMPTPEAMPGPAPEPMPEGTATQGQAGRTGPHVADELGRLSNAQGERPGSMADRIAIRRGDEAGGNRPGGFADREVEREGRTGGTDGNAAKEERSLADEQRLRRQEQDKGRER